MAGARDGRFCHATAILDDMLDDMELHCAWAVEVKAVPAVTTATYSIKELAFMVILLFLCWIADAVLGCRM
jgi:hypothetical protein